MSPSSVQFDYSTKIKYVILFISVKNNIIKTSVISTPNGTNIVVLSVNSIQELNTTADTSSLWWTVTGTIPHVGNGIHKH